MRSIVVSLAFAERDGALGVILGVECPWNVTRTCFWAEATFGSLAIVSYTNFIV